MVRGCGYDKVAFILREWESSGVRKSENINMEFKDGQCVDNEKQFENFLDNEGYNRNGVRILETSDEENEDQTPPLASKRYVRHTKRQIKRMEEAFKQNQLPDKETRKLLSNELGLTSTQVKFWFQNKRTQLKTQESCQVNKQLKKENEKLRAENMRCWKALSSGHCTKCSPSLFKVTFDEENLKNENAQLMKKIDILTKIIAGYSGMSLPSYTPLRCSFSSAFNPSCETIEESNPIGELALEDEEIRKKHAMFLAIAAIKEFLSMVELGEPLWHPGGYEDSVDKLNQKEYYERYYGGIEPKDCGFVIEGTRASTIILMSPNNLVDLLMDVNKWSSVFSSIISRAMVTEVLYTGEENHNGTLQVMSAEYQLPSPWLPVEASSFLRYCKKFDNFWAIVDVSMESINPNLTKSCRRRPSGCLIKPLSPGCLKIIWIEHVEVEMGHIYKVFLNYSLIFGAKRWVVTLDRKFDRLKSVIAVNNIDGDDNAPSTFCLAATSVLGIENLLKFAERMVKRFCSGITGSVADGWKIVSSCYDDVRIWSRKSVRDPSWPSGIILSASTSYWLPVHPKKVFDFLNDKMYRSKWDLLSGGKKFQELANVAIGQGNENKISLLHFNDINSEANISKGMMLIQESYFDVTCSYVIYAPLPMEIMNCLLNNGRLDQVLLLSSGFAIVPSGSSLMVGSLITAAFQVIVDSERESELSPRYTEKINNLVMGIIEKTKNLLLDDNPSS